MEDRIRGVAAQLQDFALGRESAESVIASMARLVGADKGWLLSTDGTVDGARPFVGLNAPGDAIYEYIAHYASRDVQLQALAAKFGVAPPSVVVDQDAMPFSRFQRSELFSDFYRPMGVCRMIRLSTANLNPVGVGRHLQFTLAHAVPDRPFEQEQVRLLRMLAPQFDAAALAFIDRQARSHASLAAAFENASDAMAILDRQGLLRYCNSTFRILAGELDRDIWRWQSPLDSRALLPVRRCLDEVLNEMRHLGMAARCTECPAMNGGVIRRYTVALSSILVGAGIHARRGEPLFMLVMRESRVRLDDRIRLLRSRYRLTATQTRVLEHFAQGDSLTAIADRLEVSMYAVRVHLRDLLAKTGCRRQAELMRLVHTAAAQQFRLEL